MPPKIMKKGKSGQQNTPGAKGKATKAVPMDSSESEEESNDSGSSEEDETPPPAIVKKKPVPAKKQEPSDDESEEDSESDEEEEEKPMAGQKRKLPQQKAQPNKKTNKGNGKQKPEMDSEDEDDPEDEEDSEESEEEPVVDLKKQKQFQQTPKNKASVNGKQAQKVVATEESSEDEDDSDEEEEEESDDEEEEEEVEVQPKGKDGKKKKKSVEAADAVPDGDVVTLFCGKLKDDCEPKDLKKLFTKNGIETTDVRKQVGKRFGYVDLANASDLEAALALDKSSFQDQEIKIEQAKKRPDLTGTPKTPNAAKDKSHKDDEDSTLFVKNLADSVTEDALKELFSDAVELRMPKSHDGNHKGFAYILFKDAGVVEKMMNKYQGAELEGQALYLDYVGQKSSFKSPKANKSSGEAGKSKVLFVKNLAYSVTDDKLLDTFEGAVSARIPTFPDTGKPKGFAFIDFESAEAAQEAFDKCQGQELEGREMKVDFALDKGDRRSSGGGFGGRGRGGRGNFRGGRGGRGGNWDRGGRGGRGGGRGGGDRGFGDKRKSFDSSGPAKGKKIKLDSDSD